MSISNKIKSLSFFQNLNENQLDKLVKISSIDTYDEEYILYYENEQISKLFFLVDGLAKAYKIDKNDNEIFLYYIQNNNILCEISSIEDYTFSTYSNISFIEKSQILSIDYQLFKKYFLDTNILTNNLIKEIINRSKKLESLINREFIFDAVTKVSMMIGTDLKMFNKLKRHDIALILNIQPATLSRVLNRLKKDNLIGIIQGQVSILNKQNLENIYKEKQNEEN